MSDQPIRVDVVIVGGGIAGLWLHNRLRRQGWSVLLLERDRLGGEQTLLSQGIIHGGLKYALGGGLSSESEAIADMPERWRACLAGNGELDLTGVRALSDAQYLWSAGSVASRMTTFFASRMLRGRIHRLDDHDYPSALRDPAFRGRVYQLDDLVVDTESLVRALVRPHAEEMLQFDPERDRLEWNESGVSAFHVGGQRIEAGYTVLAAGAGNDELLAEAHRHDLAGQARMQRRPLKMMLIRHNLPHRLYAHCLGQSSKPRLTVTTHDLPDGSLVWYLGGDLAERGADMDDTGLIEFTRAELHRLLPWLDFRDADFVPVNVDRAEPRQQKLVKPDNAWAERHQRLIVTWPTKLTLAPDLGGRVETLLREGDSPAGHPQPEVPAGVPRARTGRPDWYRIFGAGND
jgi:glycerol-3-phosphate dehydrogenase